MCGGRRTETILNSFEAKKGIFKNSKLEGDFARMYSCHLKRLSCVIFMKETATARRGKKVYVIVQARSRDSDRASMEFIM